MASLLTLENRLLLACARTEPDVQHIQALVARGPDWQAILRKTEGWGLAPLVYTNLRQAVQAGQMPKEVADRLRYLSHRDTIHDVARRELLRTTLLRLAEASIPVIVLKGAALATLVYPSPALRPMRDIDLLIQRDDQDRLEAVLRSMRDGDTHPRSSLPDPKRLALLDVRYDLFHSRSSADGLPTVGRMPIAGFWERARPVQIEAVATLVLSHEDLLLSLAFHLMDTGRFIGHVRTLCDIGEVCRRYSEAIEWRQLVARACAYKMEKPLYYALHLAREMVGAGVPSEVLRKLRTSFGQLPLEERAITAVARRALLSDDQHSPVLAGVDRFGVRLLATRRARESATVAYRHLAQAGQRRLRRFANKPKPRRVRFTGGGLRGRLPSLAIVLPIYRPRLEVEKLAAVDRAVAILRHGDWYLIAPQSLDTSFYEQRYGKPIVRFPDACLDSVGNYSRLLLTDEFYAAFARYEYMLIIQDDVYVLRDDLPHWLSRRYDYIGAPWPDGHDVELSMSPRPAIHGCAVRGYVGNGGFSLRRIAACRHLLTEFWEEVTRWSEKGSAEDMFFGMFGQFSQQFVLPNMRVAAAFAWEASLPRMYALCEGQLPMAIHAYSKWDAEFFMDTILPAALPIGISVRAGARASLSVSSWLRR